MIDHAHRYPDSVRAMLRETLDSKREQALEWLGERWILHLAHAPKRMDVEGVLERAIRQARDDQWAR